MDIVARAAIADALMNDGATQAAVTAAYSHVIPSAVQAGAPQLFADYATWCAAMLASRGIERAHLSEHFDLLEAELVLGLSLRRDGPAALSPARKQRCSRASSV